MPNHCNNELTITGSAETLDTIRTNHLKREAYGEALDFDTIKPYPQKFKDQDEVARKHREANPNDWSVKDGFNSGGYDWCVNNWGTKWNAYDGDVKRMSPTELFLLFQTAWAPPLPIIKELSKMYPKAVFSLYYEEPGMAFHGLWVCQDGKVIDDWVKDLPPEEEEEWDDIIEIKEEM